MEPGSNDKPGVLSIPGWSRWPWLRAGFSTREGGRTSAYGGDSEQNLGWTKDDDPGVVAENRRRFLRTVSGKDTLPLVTASQVHSGTSLTLKDTAEVAAARWMTDAGRPVHRGDGLMTATPGVMLGIITADCVPVLVADTRTHAVAAFHAGWRGTLARIVERGVGSMRLEFGTRPEDVVAAIGPGIEPCCFAVGDEVRSEFRSQFAYEAELFSEVFGAGSVGPKTHLDLIEANRRQLLDAGVPLAGISVVAQCTACTRVDNGRRKYFSHRAEHGFTGRMLNVIGMVE